MSGTHLVRKLQSGPSSQVLLKDISNGWGISNGRSAFHARTRLKNDLEERQGEGRKEITSFIIVTETFVKGEREGRGNCR